MRTDNRRLSQTSFSLLPDMSQLVLDSQRTSKHQAEHLVTRYNFSHGRQLGLAAKQARVWGATFSLYIRTLSVLKAVLEVEFSSVLIFCVISLHIPLLSKNNTSCPVWHAARTQNTHFHPWLRSALSTRDLLNGTRSRGARSICRPPGVSLSFSLILPPTFGTTPCSTSLHHW